MTINFQDFFSVTAVSYFADQLGENTYYYQALSAGGNPGEQSIADQFAQLWQVPYNAAMTSQASFKGVILKNYRDLLQPFAPVGYYGRPKIAGVGNFGNTPMARQVSGLITVQSTRGGKGGKGRRYIPFPDSDANEAQGNGSPTLQYRNILTAITAVALTQMVINTGTSTLTVRPLHQTYELLPAPASYRYYEIIPTRTIYHDAWATQRRRGSFGRVNADPFL